MARFRASDLLPVAMSLSSSSHPTCGEERPVDNLATAQDEAATSFLLRLQRRCSNGSLKQIRRPRASLAARPLSEGNGSVAIFFLFTILTNILCIFTNSGSKTFKYKL
ncbi:uncharacterized protein LOC125553472 [Triticum urartu]|uniref:uncharacterized protein LOC125553472 n=1 Tax=Triticum urartu TaxID=4572 RepID=UPI002044AF7C|nr:uncharacterized protein LOC125553472 [Triticum urartu]